MHAQRERAKKKASRKRKKGDDALANQLGFVASQAHAVADRLKDAGFDEIGAEMEALANSADFFVEEYHRQKNRG